MLIYIGDYTGTWPDESLTLHINKNNSSSIFGAICKGHTFYKDNMWHQFAITVNTNTNTFYIDGVRQISPIIFMVMPIQVIIL